MSKIAIALFEASSPVIITSHIGRSKTAVSALLSLAEILAIPIVNACPTAVNVPFSHPSYTGVTYMSPGSHWKGLAHADVILVLECDLPWILANDKPQESARVFVVDSGDPLKLGIGYAHVSAELVCRADAEVAVSQIEGLLRRMGIRPAGELWLHDTINNDSSAELRVHARRVALADAHAALVAAVDAAESAPPFLLSADSAEPAFTFTAARLMSTVRRVLGAATPSRGARTLVLNEAISNYPAVWQHLRPEIPGTLITSGGSSLGWALGAAVGASLGGRRASAAGSNLHDLIVVIVGDGSFMFGVPSSAYWMAKRYQTVHTLHHHMETHNLSSV